MEESSPHDVTDISKVTMSSHTDAVYAVCAHYDGESKMLTVVSGAGDDRAYLHFVSPAQLDTPSVQTIPLCHPHTDSISSVAINNDFVGEDVSGKMQKKLIAVGSYDGAIVLYDAVDGALVKVLEGPSDVEWCCFHPKGGTVSLIVCLWCCIICSCCFAKTAFVSSK
jgi:ribosome assembly protein SQT1